MATRRRSEPEDRQQSGVSVAVLRRAVHALAFVLVWLGGVSTVCLVVASAAGCTTPAPAEPKVVYRTERVPFYQTLDVAEPPAAPTAGEVQQYTGEQASRKLNELAQQYKLYVDYLYGEVQRFNAVADQASQQLLDATTAAQQRPEPK